MLAVAEVVDDLQRRLAVGDLRRAGHLGLSSPGRYRHWFGKPRVVFARHFVTGAALVGPRAQVAPWLRPERHRQRGGACVEQAEIVQRAVVLVVLRRSMPAIDALIRRLMSLDTNTTGAPGPRFLQRQDRAGMVVGITVPKRLPASSCRSGNSNGRPWPRRAACTPVQETRSMPLMDVGAAVRLDQFVDEAADLARVAAGLRWCLSCRCPAPPSPASAGGRRCSSNLNSAVGSCINTLVSRT